MVLVGVTAPVRPPRGARRRERRRLVEHDRRSAHLAELHRIRDLAERAAAVVEAGWLQHAWIADRGRSVTGPLGWPTDHPAEAACLVGAVVQAGGGPRAAGGQLVPRTLDLAWHTLFGRPDEPVRWCPAPAVRAARVRDLTRWNDRPHRTGAEVAALLRAVGRAAVAERTRLAG
jgi:hypothetical protein